MILVNEPEFPIDHELRLVALQGDCGLREELTAAGGRYVVDPADRALQSCIELVDHARRVNAHLAVIPELAIPLASLDDLVAATGASPEPLVLIGGVEGVTPDAYRALAGRFEVAPDITQDAAGTYVNSMVVVVRMHNALKVYLRAKRFASGPENAGGPQMVQGAGGFIVLRLGPTPFVVVPLICSEFIWPDLWARLNDETPGPIDLMPVLQRSRDMDRRHLGPVIHNAYQRNLQTRFVLANQALSSSTDGTCFVVTPPVSPASPGFDHGRNELWLPLDSTYKGFRVPERTGCFWFAAVQHPAGPMNAARPPVCEGRVLAVLNPSAVDLGGLPAGLMRSAAAQRHLETGAPGWASTEPKRAYRSSLSPGGAYILAEATRTSTNDSFFQMICDDRPTWADVEPVVRELIEAAALLSCGGDTVRLAPCPGGNCTLSGRPVALLYAPAVDAALEARFSRESLLSGTALPTGIVLLHVTAASRIPHARTVGDVLRADRVSSESPELADGPTRAPASAVTIGLGEIHFCEPRELVPNLDLQSSADARARTVALLPGAYS